MKRKFKLSIEYESDTTLVEPLIFVSYYLERLATTLRYREPSDRTKSVDRTMGVIRHVRTKKKIGSWRLQKR